MTKPLVCLDLDETIISSNWEQTPNAHFTFNFNLYDKPHQVWTTKRPYLDEFFEAVRSKYLIGIYTASIATYAKQIVHHLNLTDKIEFLYTNEDCHIRFSGPASKPLHKILKKYKDVLCVDDRLVYADKTKEHLIHIPAWNGYEHDEVLKTLPNYIDYCFSQDYKKFEKRWPEGGVGK